VPWRVVVGGSRAHHFHNRLGWACCVPAVRDVAADHHDHEDEDEVHRRILSQTYAVQLAAVNHANYQATVLATVLGR